MTIVDAVQREAALNPLKSFCVSAPAGSGKTELLIQRFLALLARVQRPEQVLAITFTRKAAAEMRERVVQALQEAQAGLPCSSDHQQRTRDLALAALERDREQAWRLLHNTARLNIRTIDGFCAALTRQMPVLSAFGAQATAVDDAGPLYAEAVAELFAMTEGKHPLKTDLRALMLHFDNHWSRLSELLQGLLARRDQWLSYIHVRHSPEAAEQRLLQTVEGVVCESLAQLRQQFGARLSALYDLRCFSAQNLGEAEPRHAGDSLEDLPEWRALRHMLLTKEGSKWRSRFTVNEGFPPGKGRNKEQKEALQEIISELSADDGLRQALLEVDVLPEIEGNSTSWQLVLHLSNVLPVLAAQLLLVFERHGKVDHSQVAQSALQALGDDDYPTDLALRLDYQLEHILIDEFQDTAITQFELLRRLTRGWAEHNEANPGAPRSFLIVGDGMQSIYGFRDANVSLFLQARDHGFNGVLPEYLELQANFRSEAGVVDWVNQTFSQVFPQQDNIARGEVSFSAATAVKPVGSDPAVRLQVFHGDEAEQAELAFVCDGVAEALTASNDGSIAVLGRSRPQLQGIVAGLRERGIAFAAQDMDRLEHSPVVLDLMTLVRALSNRADRVAWMAVLRAPWCGLSLADLLSLAKADDNGRYQDLLSLCGEPAVVQALSEDGRKRLSALRSAMNWAIARRDRLSQRAWLEQLWLRLDGPATVAEKAALADAQRFFELIEQGELEGRNFDLPWLQTQVAKLYANAGDPDARVQLMTLHKAKGLEFDYVFIPALARKSGNDSRPLMLWDEFGDDQGQRSFLLAADDHSKKGEPGVYNYLAQRRKRKTQLENTRLLYVGATRAIKQLVLSATLNVDAKTDSLKAPTENTLLACIWPAVKEQAQIVEVADGLPQQHNEASWPLLQRLVIATDVSEAAPLEQRASHDSNRPAPLANRLERHSGTVVHQALEVLAQRSDLPREPSEDDFSLWRWSLACLGLEGAVLEQAFERVKASVSQTLADEQAGRWLLSSQHKEAACELALTQVSAEGEIKDIVIDRTFIDPLEGTRWVVDYKTSEPAEGQSLAEFMAHEAQRYQKQLLTYRDALSELGPEPLRCALYFTALAELHPVELPPPA